MEFYNSDSKMGSLTRCLHSPQVVGVLIFMSFPGSFNLSLGGLSAAPPLISNCGPQGRSWWLESCPQEAGDRRSSAWEPHRAPPGFSLNIPGLAN